MNFAFLSFIDDSPLVRRAALVVDAVKAAGAAIGAAAALDFDGVGSGHGEEANNGKLDEREVHIDFLAKIGVVVMVVKDLEID